MKKQSQEEFIKKSQNIFGDKLDYFKVNYVNSTQNVILVCKKHGEFEVPPGPHLSYKRGCPYCSGRKHINGQGCPKCKKSAKKDLNYVITMGQIINNNFYDYSKSVYKKMSVKIEI